MTKRILSLIAAVMLIIAQPLYVLDARCEGAEVPEISAKAAVVISADTGEIVYEKNCREKLPMASTTKIMTALLCIESGGLDVPFVVDSEAIKVEGSSMGLQEGDIVTKYALCCGMLLPSGNDAANAAAVRIAGSIPAFAELMNEKARALGLSHTFFVTPSGLQGEGHGSSAYDMAILAREALKQPVFREICSKNSMKLCFGNPPYERWLKNTNKLLSTCEGVYGVKTGFTDEAGRCLVSACERGGMRLICVTLNDRNDWQDHSSLYDFGFGKVRLVKPEVKQLPELDAVGGEADKLKLRCGDDIPGITVVGASAEDLGLRLIASPFVYAPVKEGEEAASLRVSFKGRDIVDIPLFSAENINVYVPDKEDDEGTLKKIISKLRKYLF